ncbi:hypothetical protein [Pseudonocardia adelaidensis]|uniref:ADP-ribosylglycohydrolase n=1 Tax=Pseudonocardia adelaidensis TaxID=648754 RepID=A0ABP9NT75_9PSEU
MTAALRALERLAATVPDADLGAWAHRIATPDGAVPLPGTGLRAATYPGLLRAGERCARAGLGADVVLTLVGLVAGAEHGRSAADLSRAVRAGLAVHAEIEQRIAEVTRPAGLPTGGVAPAAMCAAVLAGIPPADRPALLDLAGSLMAITPPDGPAGPWAGHAAAAGWLAVHTFTSGLAGMPDGLGHTLAAVTGASAVDDPPPGEVPVRALLERLR